MSKTPGQAAYEAFGASGGLSTVLLTPWADVSADTVARWEKIAEAAIATAPVLGTFMRQRIIELLDEPGIHPATYRVLTELLKEEQQ